MNRFFSCLIVFFVMTVAYAQQEKVYQKNTNERGELESKGWILNGEKSGYWYTYHSNQQVASKGHYGNGRKEKYWYFYAPSGMLLKEGHYKLGNMEAWWVFYAKSGQVECKIQYRNNAKNGYCLRYENDKIVKIEKFEADTKIGEWDNLKEFESENNLKDLL